MKYYNRDNYERNLESYEVPEYFTKGARNEFVYGFIVGAVIGSAVGLVSISKSRATNKSIPEQDNQFKSSIIEQSELERQEADDKVNEIKSTIDDAQNKNTEVTDAELSAQRVAIQQETSDNNLANMSPDAQEQQEVTTSEDANQSDDSLAHIDPNAEPSESEINAQQNAIKEETETSDANIDGENSNSNAVTAGTAAGGAVAASGLAKAAHDKNEALNEDNQVAENTANLLKPEAPAQTKHKVVPNLVTPKVESAVESTTDKVEQGDKKNDTKVKPEAADQRVKQTHDQVAFKDGIIVHENASGQTQSATTPTNLDSKNDGIINHDDSESADNLSSTKDASTLTNESTTESEATYSKNRPQTKKTEKAKSKIDKRTFND
ncbi:YtxH domain-containing protein [Staphylococcus saprophyticus]|nr:YtxH domain-containing protein [Staphylococcus saprophyticus]